MLSTRVNKAYRLQLKSVVRQTSTTPDAKSIQSPNPSKISSDMIGPPDPVSNLRKIIFKKPDNETYLEERYRKLRMEVQEWNHNFWAQHNSRFFEERDLYLKNNLPEGKANLTADEMSVFYKAFLDKNWKTHLTYNKEWYKKNLTLLSLAIQVRITKLFRTKESK
ncbi:COA8 family protein CG14806, mitochondrial [Vanessa atalanta]|uniref:COA8 family protein CG14806, mitochondrial n=1 Tax=Vanessa atalanta TaxID=42275 RepID=UPI001FCCE22C|nr:COA8 family protein CG14806, mitochondrial [Vanessa atalanta]